MRLNVMEELEQAGFAVVAANENRKDREARASDLDESDRRLVRILARVKKHPEAVRGVKIKAEQIHDPDKVALVLRQSAGLTLYGRKAHKATLTLGLAKRLKRSA